MVNINKVEFDVSYNSGNTYTIKYDAKHNTIFTICRNGERIGNIGIAEIVHYMENGREND